MDLLRERLCKKLKSRRQLAAIANAASIVTDATTDLAVNLIDYDAKHLFIYQKPKIDIPDKEKRECVIVGDIYLDGFGGVVLPQSEKTSQIKKKPVQLASAHSHLDIHDDAVAKDKQTSKDVLSHSLKSANSHLNLFEKSSTDEKKSIKKSDGEVKHKKRFSLASAQSDYKFHDEQQMNEDVNVKEADVVAEPLVDVSETEIEIDETFQMISVYSNIDLLKDNAISKKENVERLSRPSSAYSEVIKNVFHNAPVHYLRNSLSIISGNQEKIYRLSSLITIAEEIEKVTDLMKVNESEQENLKTKLKVSNENVTEKVELGKDDKEIDIKKTEEEIFEKLNAPQFLLPSDNNFSNITLCESLSSSYQEYADYVDYAESEASVKSASKESSSTTSIETESSDYHPTDIDWVKIIKFDIKKAIQNLYEYISSWRLSECTKWAITPNDKVERIKMYGSNYFADVVFSKPVKYCPNPLAVAKVHFTFHVSDRMPAHYPIMCTYKFEGYRTIFYALGNLAVRSADFQRNYIDTILVEKTRFYFSLVNTSGKIEDEYRKKEQLRISRENEIKKKFHYEFTKYHQNMARMQSKYPLLTKFDK